MKIMLSACVCMLVLVGFAGESGSSQTALSTTPTNWLSFVGSKTAIEEYTRDHIASFTIVLSRTNWNLFGGFSKEYAYTPSNGDLYEVMAQAFEERARLFLTTDDVGQDIYPALGFKWIVLPASPGKTARTHTWVCGKQPFKVTLDGQGNIVVPTTEVISYPLNQYLVVTNAPRNLRAVQYKWWYPVEWSPPGEPAELASDSTILVGRYRAPYIPGVANLSVLNLDGELMKVLTGKLILHYEDGGMEAYDPKTGAFVDSTAVRLRMEKEYNSPVVRLSGWPGREVFVETSTNLTTWNSNLSVILDGSGTAQVALPETSQPLFIRGHTPPIE